MGTWALSCHQLGTVGLYTYVSRGCSFASYVWCLPLRLAVSLASEWDLPENAVTNRPLCPRWSGPSPQLWNRPFRRSMRGPAYEPLNASGDAEEYVDEPQISSVPSRPAIYYGEGPFSPPSSDDEDDYAKEANNNASDAIRFEYGNEEDEEGFLVGSHRRPVRPPFPSIER